MVFPATHQVGCSLAGNEIVGDGFIGWKLMRETSIKMREFHFLMKPFCPGRRERGILRAVFSDALAAEIVVGGRRFRDAVLRGLELAGLDISNPFEMLLGLRRIGAKRLEELFGPGAEDEDALTHG